jgi:hypothetical protein
MSFQMTIHMLPKILMSREIFEALPQVYDFAAPRGTLRKALIGARWYAIDPQPKAGEPVEFAHPIEIGAFVRED